MLRRLALVPLCLGVLLAALAIPPAASAAGAGPDSADVKAAVGVAKGALDRSLKAAGESRRGLAAAEAAEFLRLERRAARKAGKVLTGRGTEPGARSLRRVAGLADLGVDSYADLLGSVPPALQARLIEVLQQLTDLRAALVEDVTAVVDQLPADVAERITAALAAFYADGDVQALVDALSDPEITAAIQASLLDLIDSVTATLQGELGDLGDLTALLPPDVAAQLEDLLAGVQAQLAGVFAQLEDILGGFGGGTGDLCSQLEDLFEVFGIPVPPGFCS